jgi:hypothetical protein
MAQGSRMRVEIYCAQDSDKSNFGRLFAKKEEIESRFPNEEVSWEPLQDALAGRVAVYRAYDKAQVSQDMPARRELFEWIGQNLTRFRDIARQYLVES